LEVARAAFYFTFEGFFEKIIDGMVYEFYAFWLIRGKSFRYAPTFSSVNFFFG